MPQKDLHEDNRVSWNAATDAHNSHKRDQAAFLRAGGSTLFPDEIELLGDLRGKTLAHLQCNAGQDTLSLAPLGATVTGVDISDTAINFARQLSVDSGIPATFERADIYDWLENTPTRYDVAFSSYGALVWLDDLKAWGKGIARVLNPGGRFVLLDFHPVYTMLGWDWQIEEDYMGGTRSTYDDGIGDYVAMSREALTPSGYLEGVVDFRNPNRAHEFGWGVAEIVMALLDAGLRLTTLREYPYSNGANLRGEMRSLPGNRFAPPEGMPQIPLMLGLVAEKPE
ncbi:MAG TPA: class I SAM-dependent methyltransferase [Phototrophicaceae bacterium]|nr:class I SAM-dependent methyltransferase [Phototrophicaceae bacterium]